MRRGFDPGPATIDLQAIVIFAPRGPQLLKKRENIIKNLTSLLDGGGYVGVLAEPLVNVVVFVVLKRSLHNYKINAKKRLFP